MYALLPVVVLMEQKFPPKDIEESQSKFTCDALLKCRCLCPAAAKTQSAPYAYEAQDSSRESSDVRP